ncbi:MAG: ketoacyl-ACP synthase III [Paludibacteraceae bacterium]|nr:ketoacyl-ACP synthase III [Paludibacteraceae bacterium]
MAFFKFEGIKINALAASVPANKFTTDDFKGKFGCDFVEKFSQKTGIKEFRKTSQYQTASDLGYAAANHILEQQQIDRESIGVLLFVAHSTDYRRPATACVLHKRLGLNKNCYAVDMNLGCSAFVYGLSTICSLMQCSDTKYALLIVGETMTKITSPEDRSVAMLFGDGGGAILLEKTGDKSDVVQGLMKTDGTGYRAIIAPAGGSRNMHAPTEMFDWEDGNARTLYNTVMNGDDVFGFTISDVPKTIKEFLAITETTVDDYDYCILHQANGFILKQLAKKLKIDEAKIPISLDRYANTSAAAIPITISDAFGNTDGAQNIKFLMSGFGVGLSWGVASATIDVQNIYPIIETEEYFAEGVINSPEDYYRDV